MENVYVISREIQSQWQCFIGQKKSSKPGAKLAWVWVNNRRAWGFNVLNETLLPNTGKLQNRIYRITKTRSFALVHGAFAYIGRVFTVGSEIWGMHQRNIRHANKEEDNRETHVKTTT